MKLNLNQIIAIQNILDCMEHYMLIDHIKDEYGENEWSQLGQNVRELQKLLDNNTTKSIPNVLNRPFERIGFSHPSWEK
jgi:hypothetical protein